PMNVVTLSCHLVTTASCHHSILSPQHLVTTASCHHSILSPQHLVTTALLRHIFDFEFAALDLGFGGFDRRHCVGRDLIGQCRVDHHVERAFFDAILV